MIDDKTIYVDFAIFFQSFYVDFVGLMHFCFVLILSFRMNDSF